MTITFPSRARRRSVLLLSLLLLSFLPVSTFGQTTRRAATSKQMLELIEFRFHGYKLGAPLTTATLQADGAKCLVGKFVAEHVCVKLRDMLGEIPIETVYFLEHEQFVGLDVSFDEVRYEQIVTIFRTKFGPPHETGQETIQNRMGASFLNELSRWFTTTGTLTISRYGTKITQGRIAITEPTYAQHIEQQQREKDQAAAKDL